MSDPMYLKSGDPGLHGGGTYTGNSTEPTLAQYENIFGPAARDIKTDQQRHKRHQRWHLPDALKGANQYLTDRVDGLITDATNSPFTRNILPYVYLENPDQKLKWNVYSFDEGIASRVPYESAARVLPQTKRSFAGYTVRQGLAIAMEHNFMVSAAGQENFKRQLMQLVGSIQLTNDLDVHVALLTAPSYQRHMNEKYQDQAKTTSQICREYVDLFGIMQKIPNALDILIEDAKNHLKTWGSQPPTFLLCNGNLTTQLTMIPEKTNYITNGPDGLRRLADGPDLPSYRGLTIINSRKFSMDAGSAPRDLLRRRVRVAEFYRIPWKQGIEGHFFEFYDQARDTMFKLSWTQLLEMSKLDSDDGGPDDAMCTQSEFWMLKPHAQKLNDIDWSMPEKRKAAMIVNGCVLKWGDEASGLTIPSPVVSTASRLAPKLYRLQDLMSVVCDPKQVHKQALNTPGKRVQHMQDYSSQSETFGGGIFNDPIVSDPYCLSNFEGLNRQHKGQYHLSRASDDMQLSTIWFMCKIYDTFIDAYINTLNVHSHTTPDGAGDPQLRPIAHKCSYNFAATIESIRNGSGQCFCLPNPNHSLFDGAGGQRANSSTMPQNTFTRLVLLYSAFHHNLTDPLDLVACTDVELVRHIGTFNAYLPNTRREIITNVLNYLEWHTDTDYELTVIRDILAPGDNLPATIANNSTEFETQYSENIRRVADNLEFDVQDTLDNLLQSLPHDPRRPRNYIDRFTEIIRLVKKQVIETVYTMQMWSHSIFMQNSYSAMKEKREISSFTKNKQLSVHVNEIFKLLKTDAVGAVMSRMDIDDNRTITHVYTYQEDDNNSTYVSLVAFRQLIAKSNLDSKATLFQDFLADMHSGNDIGLMTLNVAGMGAHDSVFTPNLHLSRCDPLRRNDMKHSATSMDPRLWMIQQFAGMTPMTDDMCHALLREHPTYDPDLCTEYEAFLNTDTQPLAGWDNAPKYAYNTFLMHWFMQNFHPSPATRAKAALKAVVGQESFTKIVSCIGHGIEHNTCHEASFEREICALAGFEYDTQRANVPFCTATLAKEYLCVTPFVNSTDYKRDGDAAIAAYRSWLDTPVVDLESGFLDYDRNSRPKPDCLKTMRAHSCIAPSPALEKVNCDTGSTSADARQFYNPITRRDETLSSEHVLTDVCLPWLHRHRWTVQDTRQNPWIYQRLKHRCIGINSQMYSIDVRGDSHVDAKTTGCKHVYDPTDSELLAHAHAASDFCRNPENVNCVVQHVLLVLANRFWKPAARFSDNGKGVPVVNQYTVRRSKPTPTPSGHLVSVANYNNPGIQRQTQVGLMSMGMHFMHGTQLPTTQDNANGSQQSDIIILRPNIEHEMLGVVMGRGGTQELGATFWGQTELSCYDDAQHGIWGMSYKYHERAIVTNERNLIRVYDVAFDGYNGGMDQSALNWNSAHDRHRFRTATYARDRAYNGPSMLVMALPHNNLVAHKPFPNPIVFHPHVTGSVTPDSEKGQRCPDINEHMVFNYSLNPEFVPQCVQDKYEMYMRRLEMNQWASIDQSNRPAGENCVANETSSSMLAFQGTMREYNSNHALVETIQGSGHLGPSYVGVASVREGRGLMTASGQPLPYRVI